MLPSGNNKRSVSILKTGREAHDSSTPSNEAIQASFLLPPVVFFYYTRSFSTDMNVDMSGDYFLLVVFRLFQVFSMASNTPRSFIIPDSSTKMGHYVNPLLAVSQSALFKSSEDEFLPSGIVQ